MNAVRAAFLRAPLLTTLLAGGLVLLLFIPSRDVLLLPAAGTAPFAWHQDDRWIALERRFLAARTAGCPNLQPQVDSLFMLSRRLLDSVSVRDSRPTDSLFSRLENRLFDLAPLVAACPERTNEYLALLLHTRAAVKHCSERWDSSAPAARAVLYRILYGGRLALEEVLLQSPPGQVPVLAGGGFERSRTPAATLLGVPVHSGDILVSRGGAPTSALIARGSDYPGNFSHVALVHVDSSTGTLSIIESHIERGVAVATVDEYLRDTKLRMMILRLRSDLPAVASDPLLPHRAASAMLDAARRRHIPYDFAMNWRDTTAFFCSEVVSQSFRRFGITLWPVPSRISSPGVAAWLGAFGVRNTETQEPSDLEYDPQLRVVAEWRDPATLFRDHVDNAILDVMLESADRGEPLEYSWYLLPAGRLLKAYSGILNWFGAVGPVPEGMDAAAALRNRAFSERHVRLQQEVLASAEVFRRTRGYVPPYWELLRLARAALAAAGNP